MIETLFSQFNALTEQSSQLHQRIIDETKPGWVVHSDSLQHYRAIAQCYQDWWYSGEGDARRTVNYHGLLLASQATINCAKELNKLKTELQQTIQLLQKDDRLTWLNAYPLLIPSKQRDSLKQAGLSRLHLKQCYRQIPILEQVPEKIGFSWYSNGKSITRVSKQDAYKRLEKLGQGEHIQIQQQKIAALNDSETLAIIQRQAPCVRANIVYKQDGRTTRKACNSSLPFLILDNKNALPIFNKIPRKAPAQNTRLQRSDIKIDPIAIAPSIRAHRYLPTSE